MSLSNEMSLSNDLNENYSWVDKHLEQKYHNYAINMDNWMDYYDAGLLTENWAWVDQLLEKQYTNIDFMPCPAPICWVRYRSFDKQYSIENDIIENEKRTRAESDISKYSDKIEDIYNSFILQNSYNNYNYYLKLEDEYESSIDLGSDTDYDSDGIIEDQFSSPYGWY